MMGCSGSVCVTSLVPKQHPATGTLLAQQNGKSSNAHHQSGELQQMAVQDAEGARSGGSSLAQGRSIRVHFASGDLLEITAEPGEAVRDLCRQIADLKGAGWATLLIGEAPVDETLAASSLPEGQLLTAIVQDDLDRPDRLNNTVRHQIRQSLEMHGACVLDQAFRQPDWQSFVTDGVEGIQDFYIKVFEFKGERFLHFDYGMGDNGFGSIHAVGIVDAIMRIDDGHWEPLACADCTSRLLGQSIDQEQAGPVWSCKRLACTHCNH